VLVTLRQNKRAFVEKLDFLTSSGQRITAVITDMGILNPDPGTRELTLTSVHPGVTPEKARQATSWPLKVAAELHTTAPPSANELTVLRDLQARTARAHG
jgi:glutaconate CoA-transferase subunit B